MSPMTRWEVFRLLCTCLGPALAADRPNFPSAAVPWPLVVDAADDHLVGPALGWCLRGDERVPDDVRTCFETLLDLNRRRNDIMRQALQGALDSLNAAGITPMLLKGGAALVQDFYADAGMRIVGDLDLMVRDEEIETADAALTAAGFAAATARPSAYVEPHHHLPVRVHSTLKVGVELHTRPLPRALDALLNAPGCFGDARRRLWRDRQLLLPGPTDSLVHSIAHGQIVDGYYWRGTPRLRQLLELVLIRRHFASEVDLRQAEDRFGSAGYRKVFRDTALVSAFLLEGLEAPHSAEAADAIARVRAAVTDPATNRWVMYRRFLFRNARRAIVNPRFAVRTLRPSFWAEFRGSRKRVQMTRW